MLKAVASNTMAQLVAKFFGAGLTLLTTYYTILVAGLPLYGDLTKILVLVAIGFTVIDFGLNAEAVRYGTTPARLRSVLGSVILARLLLSLLVIGILNLVIYFLPGGYSPAVKHIFWLGSLAIIFQGLFTSSNSYFQSTLSYWRSTVSVVAGSLTGTALTLYYLFTSPTLPHIVLANTLGYLVIAACSLLFLPRPYDFKTLRLSTILPLLRRALPLGLILIASVLASKVDTVILGIFRSSSEVGEYGFAYRIFDVILVLPVFVMNSLYPLLIRRQGNSSLAPLVRRTTLAMGTLGIIVAILLWLSAPLVLYVRPELTLSIQILRILAFATPLFYVTAPLMWVLISARRDQTVLWVYLAAALFNTLTNLVFVPSHGAAAAALATGATELLIFLSLLYFSYRSQP